MQICINVDDDDDDDAKLYMASIYVCVYVCVYIYIYIKWGMYGGVSVCASLFLAEPTKYA